jgi:hypothetical protein
MENSQHNQGKWDLWKLKIRLALAEKNYKEALALAESYADADKKSYYLKTIPANLSFLLPSGNPEKGNDIWRRSLSEDPQCKTDDGYFVCLWAIKFYILTEQYSDASRLAKNMLNAKKSERHWELSYEHMSFATVFTLSGDREEAEKMIAEMDRREGTKFYFYMPIIETYYYLGKPEKARQFIDRYTQILEREDYTDIPEYALAMAYKGEINKAVHQIEALLKKFPRDDQTLVAAAKIYRLAGDAEKADSAIQTLISTGFFNYMNDLTVAYAMKK